MTSLLLLNLQDAIFLGVFYRLERLLWIEVPKWMRRSAEETVL